MSDLAAALVATRQILLTANGLPPILIRGDPDPDNPEIIVLDVVTDTSRQHYGGSTTEGVFTISCYAETLSRALFLDTQSRHLIESGGIATHRQTRVTPTEEGYGVLADYTTR